MDVTKLKQVNNAIVRFEKALGELNAAGSDLNRLGYEPQVGGWTQPSTWGYIRCQGNLNVKYEELRRA